MSQDPVIRTWEEAQATAEMTLSCLATTWEAPVEISNSLATASPPADATLAPSCKTASTSPGDEMDYWAKAGGEDWGVMVIDGLSDRRTIALHLVDPNLCRIFI